MKEYASGMITEIEMRMGFKKSVDGTRNWIIGLGRSAGHEKSKQLDGNPPRRQPGSLQHQQEKATKLDLTKVRCEAQPDPKPTGLPSLSRRVSLRMPPGSMINICGDSSDMTQYSLLE